MTLMKWDESCADTRRGTDLAEDGQSARHTVDPDVDVRCNRFYFAVDLVGEGFEGDELVTLHARLLPQTLGGGTQRSEKYPPLGHVWEGDDLEFPIGWVVVGFTERCVLRHLGNIREHEVVEFPAYTVFQLNLERLELREGSHDGKLLLNRAFAALLNV